MSLLTLPSELRLRIYEYLPDLKQDRVETVSVHPSALTPAICRTSTLLRQETLPIFASNSLFSFPIDDAPDLWARRVDSWIQALSPSGISRIRSIQFSQHWKITQPMRWMRHVGFYLRVERPRPIGASHRTELDQPHGFNSVWAEHFVKPSRESSWQVTTGTYPMYVPCVSYVVCCIAFHSALDPTSITSDVLISTRARDARGMRLQSIELLAQIVQARFRATSLENAPAGLTVDDIRFLLQAVNIIASHAISYYDFDASDDADKKPCEIWSNMKTDLELLAASS